MQNWAIKNFIDGFAQVAVEGFFLIVFVKSKSIWD